MVAIVKSDALPDHSTTGRCRLLLVDDDPDIVRGTTMRLTAAGYEVVGASSGRQCLSLANREHPDAILLDVRMPGQDGLETLSKLHASESTRDIPVIMLSGSVADEETALKRGARYFLRKPCCRDSLLAAVDSVTNGRIARSME